MKKTLLALAVAGVVAAPVAMAEVTVYGQAHLSVDALEGADDQPGFELVNRASRVGVKAAEDLGNGLTAVAQYEWGVNVETDGAITGRNQFVGLAGGFGTLAMGRHDTPYKISTGKLDAFSDQLGDYNSVITWDNRLGNVIAYLSPNLSGFTVNAAIVTDVGSGKILDAVLKKYGLDDQLAAAISAATGDTVTAADVSAEVSGQISGSDPYAVSIGAQYANGPLYLALAMEQTEAFSDLEDALEAIGLDVGTDVSAMRAGAGYEIAGVKLGAVYENLEIGGEDLYTSYNLSAAASVSEALTVKAAYGSLDWDASGADDGTMFAIGADYALSKTTLAYVQYADSEDTQGLQDAYLAADEDGKMSGVSAGLIVKF